MTKNKEWLKKEVNELPLRFLGFSMLKQREEFTVSKDDVLELINQLDEPEDLTQEWIDEYSYNIEEYWEVADMMDKPQYAVSVENLQNLLVLKQEEVDQAYKDGYEKGRELGFYKGYREGLGNKGGEPEVLSQEFIDKYKVDYDNWMPAVPIVHLQNLLVPKQELPVIPKFVAYVIEAYKSNSRLTNLLADLAFHGELAEFVEHEDEDEVFEWARSNRKATDEILARAWLDGFTVEEQKYYAKVKGWGVNGNDGHVYYSGKFPLSLALSIESVAHTKDEWKNYGVYEDNADFVKVEELEE